MAKNPDKKDAPQQDTLTRQDMAAAYGWNLAVLRSDPDLFRIFKQAVAQTWTPDRFVAEVRGTGWFKTHSDATRNYIILKKSDPQTFTARTNQARASVKDQAAALGAQLSDQAIARIADNFLRFGWNDSQLRDTLAGAVGPGAQGTYGGQAAGNVEHLRATALANGVRISDPTLNQWAVRLAAGESIEGFDQYVRGMAKSAFPSLSERIDAGENVDDIAQPYKQQMAQTLEVNPESIDLFDPTLRQALQAQNKDGQIAMKPLWQFESELRHDQRFDNTSTARTDAAKFATNLGQMFGAL